MGFSDRVISSQKELNILSKNNNYLITQAKYGPSRQTKIPLIINKKLAFFVGAIIGDGHLRKSKFQTTIELTNKDLLNLLKDICFELFNRSFNISKEIIRENRKNSWVLIIDSKSIYLLLKDVFEIPCGKKSSIVKVPKFIIQSDSSIKLSFLKGIMATEGGKRKRGYGLSTASKELWEGLIALFEDVGIKVLRDSWEYKKYKKKYYGLCFKKEYFERFMWICRSGQTGDV